MSNLKKSNVVNLSEPSENLPESLALETQRNFYPCTIREGENGNELGVVQGMHQSVFGECSDNLGDKLTYDVMQFSQIGSALTEQGVDELNRNMALVHGIAPNDPIEAMLATQMAAIHNATISYSRKLQNASEIDTLNAYQKALNKLANTFTNQVDALRKHRTKGKQTVVVKHVTVNDGGQAIVGDINPMAKD